MLSFQEVSPNKLPHEPRDNSPQKVGDRHDSYMLWMSLIPLGLRVCASAL